MGIAPDGPFGPFKGKIGPIYGYIRSGKTIIRARPHITKPRTESQKAVLQRMQVLTPFFKMITPYLSIGFKLASVINDNSPNNSAKSYNLKNAIKGLYPNQELDYTKIRLTEGSLPPPQDALVTSVADGLNFTWTYDAYEPSAGANDKTMVLAFFTELKVAISLISGVERKRGLQTLQIPLSLKGREAETYISFITDNRKSISNSVYTGKILF